MSNQARITIRPPAHRDFIHGYAGIPASTPNPNFTPPVDPLLPLPVLLRPQAHLSGTVDVRTSTKGGGTKARWLRVELEKIETVPSQALPPANGGKSGGKEAKTSARFVELIGNGPGTLWQATEDDVTSRKGGKSKDDEEGWDFIPEGSYPFRVALPEGLPPTTDVDSRGSGIAYQLVATLCAKGKKGLLKSAKITMLTSQAPLLLLKADLLPTWPAYSPVLPLPLPAELPWINQAGNTIGETRESKVNVSRNGREGLVWMKCTREKGAFGPGDPVQIRVQIGWDGPKPIKLTRLDFVLRETLTFRYPAPSGNNASAVIRAQPRSTVIFTANASVSTDPDNPTAFAVLYENEPVGFNLTGIVPAMHSRVTVRTAKHIDVGYHLKIRAMLEGGEELSCDGWSVVIGGVGSRDSRGLVEEIGWVEGLCDRPGLTRNATAAKETNVAAAKTAPVAKPDDPVSASVNGRAPTDSAQHRLRTTSTPQLRNKAASQEVESPRPNSTFFGGSSASQAAESIQPTPSPARSGSRDVIAEAELQPRSLSPPPPIAPTPAQSSPYLSAEEEKRRLYNSARETANRQQQFRIQNADSPPPATYFTTNPSAEDEKRRLYEAAQITRDRLQSSVNENPVIGGMSAEDEKTRLHRAAVLRRDQLQGMTSPSSPPLASASEKVGLFEAAVSTRDEVQRAFSASPVRSNTSMSMSAAGSLSIRSNSILPTAEAEKKRLFENAKAIARQRKEEARIEFEKQKTLVEEMEREEMTMSRMELEEERARMEAELRMRDEQERARLAEERRIQLEFEIEQADRARNAEAKWRREEEARQEVARMLHEKQQQEDLQRQAEQRRQLEQNRQAEAVRQTELLKQRLGSIQESPAQQYQHQHYDHPMHRSGSLPMMAPSPQNPTSHAQFNPQGSFSPPPTEMGMLPSHSAYGSNPPAGIERTGSSASFAPGMSVHNANQAFYINAIASSLARNPTSRSEEKEAYLRSLRERSEAGRYQNDYQPDLPRRQQTYDQLRSDHQGYGGGFTHQEQYSPPVQFQQRPPPPQHSQTLPPLQGSSSYPHQQHDHSGHHDVESYAHPPADSPSTPRPLARASPSNGYHHSPSPPESSHLNQPQPQQQQFKSALQEKEEERARREAETRRTTVEPVDQEVADTLPTYDTDRAPQVMKTAAQEKADLTAHYERARAAVEAFQRGPPPVPPQRQQSANPNTPVLQQANVYQNNQHPAPSSGPPTWTASPEPIPSHSAGYEAPAENRLNGGHQHYQEAAAHSAYSSYDAQPQHNDSTDIHEDTGSSTLGPGALVAASPEDSDESSSEVHRDPQVTAGKRRAADVEAAPSFGTAPDASAPSAPWLLSSPDFGTFSITDGLSFEAAQAQFQSQSLGQFSGRV